MLQAETLSKSYRGREVLKGCSVLVKRGETVGLLGPNGAGKTTCFYIIVGLIQADQGSIHLDEVEITSHPMNKRAELGLAYLPQEPSVFRRLTVAQNILAALELGPRSTRKERYKQLEHLLEELQVSHIAEQKGQSLSGGERRRVEIARALASNPSFILLDEPFAGVDPISVGEIQRIIAHLKAKNIGVLITDHQVRETLGICDRAYILNEGNVIMEGTTESIISNDEVRNVYLGKDFKL